MNLLGLSTFLVLGILGFRLRHIFKNIYLDQFSKQLMEALEVIVHALKAGSTFQQALSLVIEQAEDPLKREFQRVFNEHRLGIGLEACLDRLAERVGLEDLKSLTACVHIAQSSGGSLATVLAQLAGSLRENLALRDRLRALSAQGKLQGWIMGMLPFVLMVIYYFLEPNLITSFLRSPMGEGVLSGIFILEIMAFWVMQSILDIRV